MTTLPLKIDCRLLKKTDGLKRLTQSSVCSPKAYVNIDWPFTSPYAEIRDDLFSQKTAVNEVSSHVQSRYLSAPYSH